MTKQSVAPADQKKILRDLLDRALTRELPQMGEAEFSRAFGMQWTPDMAGMTYAELLIRQLVLKACAGNDKSIQEILDRLVGKPVQTAEIKSVSYTYNDFLLSCVEADQKDKLKVIDVPPLEQPETDLLKDLL